MVNGISPIVDFDVYKTLNFEITVDTPVVTSNNMYGISGNKVFKKKETNVYQEEIMLRINMAVNKNNELIEKITASRIHAYAIDLYICKPRDEWFTGKGNNQQLKKIDLENIMKTYHDAMIRAFNSNEAIARKDEFFSKMDDSFCIEMTLHKSIDDSLEKGQTRFINKLKLFS